MRLHGLGEAASRSSPHRPYELGPFVVTFVPSRHSKLLFGRKVPMDGELTCDHLARPRAGRRTGAARSGGSGSRSPGSSLYHQGSADLDDASSAARRSTSSSPASRAARSRRRYWERILPRLDPRVVVPTHYDDFFAPLGSGFKFVRKVELERVPSEVGAVSRDARVAALPRVDVTAPEAPSAVVIAV